MSDTTGDLGVGVALSERMRTQRLPRAQELKARVDAGGLLTDADISFLEQVFADSKDIAPYLERNPSWKPLAAQMMDFYHQITAKALENEKASAGPEA